MPAPLFVLLSFIYAKVELEGSSSGHRTELWPTLKKVIKGIDFDGIHLKAGVGGAGTEEEHQPQE